MKKLLLLLMLTNFVNVQFTLAQFTAGTIPVGMSSINPNINLSNAKTYQSVTKSFRIDCDTAADFSVELYKGVTATDGANLAYLHVLNSLFEICADTGVGIKMSNYYNKGDTLNCAGKHKWAGDNIYELGNYGCMVCPGPSSASNLYIAYRIKGTSQVGWIKVTFNLVDNGSTTAPITLSITTVLSSCTTNAVQDISDKTAFKLYPNPVTDGILHIEGIKNTDTIEFYNLLGEKVLQTKGAESIDISSLFKSVYFLKILNTSGERVYKIIIQ